MTPRPFVVTVVNPPTPEQASALVGLAAPLIGALIREAEQREAQDRNAAADATTDVAAA